LCIFFERFPARERFYGAAGQAHGGGNLGEGLARLPQGKNLMFLYISHAITHRALKFGQSIENSRDMLYNVCTGQILI